MSPKKDDTYRCSLCHHEFATGWTEEEAREEQNENYPGLKNEDAAIVCDGCYDIFRAGMN